MARDIDDDRPADDQAPRGEGLEDGSTIKLIGKQERFRIAECAAKGGEYVNGSCQG